MQLLSYHKGQLHTDTVAAWDGAHAKTTSSFTTGLTALDQLLPGGAFARGVIHELLALPQHPFPLFAALVLARGALHRPASPHFYPSAFGHPERSEGSRFGSHAVREPSSFAALRMTNVAGTTGVAGDSPAIEMSDAIIWSDPTATLYPPAIAAMGVPMDRFYMLRPNSIADENWAITECLRCRGVGAVVAAPRKMSRIEARRFQLAAERGGGIGILLRPYDRSANVYAAATRWLVAPHPGERTVQKWKLQLIHGHGGQIGQTVILEHHRDAREQTHPVRATVQLADRSVQAPTRSRSATG